MSISGFFRKLFLLNNVVCRLKVTFFLVHFLWVLVIWEVFRGIRSGLRCELSSFYLVFSLVPVRFLFISVHFCVVFGSLIGLVALSSGRVCNASRVSILGGE